MRSQEQSWVKTQNDKILHTKLARKVPHKMRQLLNFEHSVFFLLKYTTEKKRELYTDASKELNKARYLAQRILADK